MNPLFSCTNVGDRTSTDLMACLLRDLSRAGRLLAWALAVAAFSFAQISHDLDSPAETAAALAKKAKKAVKAGDTAEAYIYYSEASALQPKKRAYRARMEALQTRAIRQSKSSVAGSAVSKAGSEAGHHELAPHELSPEDVFDSLTARDMANARPLEGAQRLKPRAGSQEFDLTGDARSLWDTVAARFGLEAVYDGDYPRGGERVRFRLDRADYRDALHALEASTSSFVIPLSPRIFMVAKDTQTKRQQLEQTLTLAVPVPYSLTSQELMEIAQTVRQITDIQKIGLNSATNQIVMRDRVSRVVAAQALLRELTAARAETLIDIEYLEVTDSDMVQFGVSPTNQFQVFYLGHFLNNAVTLPSGITNLITFGGGKTLIGITAAEAQALFNETTSSSRLLYRSQVRAQSGQEATFHVGDRYPVITSGYFGAVPPNQQGQVYAPPPAFTFEDLGIEVKVKPFVHGANEMTLSVETSFEVLTGLATNGIPVIGNRKVKTDARVRNDEWTVVAGLTDSTRAKSISGIWGFADAPILGPLFKQTTTNRESGYVLIGVRPHLLSLPPDQIATKTIAFGTETRAITPL
jgi:general secretion pathway protein D